MPSPGGRALNAMVLSMVWMGFSVMHWLCDEEPMSRIRNALLRAEHHLDTWKHANRDYDKPIFVDAYEGHGADGSVLMRGRVLANLPIRTEADQGMLMNIRDMLRRYASDEVPYAKLDLSLPERTISLETDRDGYYSTEFSWKHDAPSEGSIWHDVTIELCSPTGKKQEDARFTAPFQYPDERAQLAVICDIDDTVIQTGAQHLWTHANSVLTNNPYTRKVFAGMPQFLQGLVQRDGEAVNPMFFLSSSPWNLHRFFQKTFEIHQVPRGTFFLKDFGLEEDHYFKSGHGQHKSEHARMLMKTYPDLKFVLIGDSGQQDMEIYEDVIRESPDRIAACYIRDVTGYGRGKKITEKFRQLERDCGVSVGVFCYDSVHMATHASLHGLLDEGCLEEVERVARAERFSQLEDALL